jgi:S-adenosyl-L-methionine methyltransferase
MTNPLASRLDSAIRRLSTLRACLDWATDETANRPGPVMEFGLGNGRSYDHLRKRLPGRDIHVFDRHVAAHPDCVPPAEFLRLGDFRDTAPAAVNRFAGQVALIHGDVGSGDDAASRALSAELAPYWAALLQDNGLLVSDQPVGEASFTLLPLPGGEADRYYLARRNPR